MIPRFSSLFTAIFLFAVSLYSQEAGKIYTAGEADKQFGEVLEWIKMPTSKVRYWLRKSENSLMFNIVGRELIVLGENRELVYSNVDFTDKDEVFHLYSLIK